MLEQGVCMQLTHEQAYLAMCAFLDRQVSNGWEELAGILGSMSLLSDGKPVDPAFASDWQEAIATALAGEVQNLRINRHEH
jgi:hypothetical protein